MEGGRSSKVPGSIQVAWAKKGTVTKPASSLPGPTQGAQLAVLLSATSLTTAPVLLTDQKAERWRGSSEPGIAS